MARKKSIIASLIESQQKKSAARKKEDERRQREQQRLHERWLRQQAAEAKTQQREQERREREDARSRAQAERERARAERERQRAAEQAEQKARRAEREQAQQQERERKDRERSEARAQVEALQRDASHRTEQINRHLAGIHDILRNRDTSLRSHAHEVNEKFNNSGPIAAAKHLQSLINASQYPSGCAVTTQAQLYPAERQLMVDAELPRQELIPDVVSYRLIKQSKEMRPEPRKVSDRKELYQDAIARITLRCIAEIMYATPAPIADSVILNGFVSTKDKSTGQPVRPCVISVEATRDIMDQIILDEPELDPMQCLRHLRAIVSPHPFDLEPVKPVAYFDPSKYKLVDEIGSVAGLDSRIDLLALSPTEFEFLIRELFEAVGLKSWVRNTQGSRDEGIDAVAVNDDPLVGGECVIQAKRYKAVVGLESVHALAGAMQPHSAARGILVTTSWFGKASRDYANEHGRIQLIDGRNLKAMLAEHLGLDVLIGLPKVPPGWQREDID